ncbi:MAG: hypothetical protein JW715_07465 [Sedimentisphaerales bacterium]|nr:hypothetical protein [Sedimentisphaerales bacterium]
MNTIWLKIAGIIVAIVIVFVLVIMFTSNNSEEPEQTEQPQRTFADQVEADRQKFSNIPQPIDSNDQQVPEQDSAAVIKTTIEETNVIPAQPEPAKPVTLYFKPMSQTDQIEAERFYNVAVQDRSIGRLPGTGYKLMVENCRRIIQKWPDSKYAYKSKQMMADLREQYKQRYNITPDEIDVSMYSKPRPGTQPYN